MADEPNTSDVLCAYRRNLIAGGFSGEVAEAICHDAAQEIHSGNVSRSMLKNETAKVPA